MSFEAGYKEVGISEGGYSKDPKDPGGETYDGIARKRNGSWEGWALIDKLIAGITSVSAINKKLGENAQLHNLVNGFYYNEFWLRQKCDQIDRMSPIIAQELFEASVNCGRKNGAKFLQRALDRLNVYGTKFADIEDDGGIGNDTMKALTACLKIPGRENLVFRCQNGEQYIYYTKLPQHERYCGWFART